MKIQQKKEEKIPKQINRNVYRDSTPEKPAPPGTKIPIQTHQKPECRDVRVEKYYEKQTQRGPQLCMEYWGGGEP